MSRYEIMGWLCDLRGGGLRKGIVRKKDVDQWWREKWCLHDTYQNQLTQIELSQQYTTVVVSEVLDRLERLETSQKGDLEKVKGLLNQLVMQGNGRGVLNLVSVQKRETQFSST
ncbi:hypothetical protein PM082_024453 [Marasmius tenuissimus]|nr:hypothetical protein PM082_024453 [Marasmius tenuissimus]